MQGKRLKKLIMQWVIPTILLIILLVSLLYQFKEKNEKIVSTFVESSVEQTGGTYSRNIQAMLSSMKGVADIVDDMLEYSGTIDIFYLMQSLDAVENSCASFSIVYCNLDGSAVTNDHQQISLGTTDYFTKLQGIDSFFSYTKDDGITGQPAILYVCPIHCWGELKGYLVAYMNPEYMAEIIKDGNGYGNEVFYAIVDSKGDILSSFGGTDATSFLTDDFWNSVKSGTEIEGSWNVFDRQRENGQFGKILVSRGDEHRLLCQFPIEGTDWHLVMGLNQAYMSRMLDKIWNPMVWLLVKIGICLISYLTVVVVLNVISRIRSTEQKRELEDKADTDLLTDLNNKAATERKIREYMRSHPEEQAILFVLDVDNFKKINDTLGHAFGDEVLRNLGMRLRSMFRVTDIIGRIGGDEFIVFLKDIKDNAVIEREGKKIEQFFHNFEVGEYVKYSVTASVGGAVFPKDADNFEDLYKAADKAVYISKKQGKNQLSYYKKDNE